MRSLNEINKRKKEKYRTSFDWQHSHIKRMEELPDILFGGVKSKNDATHLAFLVKNGKIELSDLRGKGHSVFDYVFDLKSQKYSGRGTVNHFRQCEMYVYYVLLLLESLDG